MIETQRKRLEAFARDWLLLIRSARVYPGGHPSLQRVTSRMAGSPLLEGPLSLGVTPTELILEGHFFGGRKSRATDLARLLFSRRIQTLTIRPGADTGQFLRLAFLISDPGLEPGVPLAERAEREGITDLSLVPLDIERVHEARSRDTRKADADVERQGQEAWLWLHAETTSPEAVACALRSSNLWEGLSGDAEEAQKIGYLLTGLGARLEQGLASIDQEGRGEVLRRMAALGEKVSPEALADMVLRCPDVALLQRDGMTALLGDLEGEKLIDVMAGVLSAEGQSSERMGSLVRFFTPANANAALDAVRMRLKEADYRGFAAEVWRDLETLLFHLFDKEFLDDSYRETLDGLSQGVQAETYRVEMDFAAGVESSLNMVYLNLALAVGGLVEGPWNRLFDRITSLASLRREDDALNLLEGVDGAAPYALDTRPDFIGGLLLQLLDNARDLTPELRARIRSFANRHQRVLLEILLDTLKTANRISLRKLVVDLLGGMDNGTTPRLVSAARAGPWYLTRNLLIVFGRRGDLAALPFVVSMLDNAEPRVRREALRTLSALGDKGFEALDAFRRRPKRDPKDVELAQALLERKEAR